MKVDWQGVFPEVTTGFREDESLDLEATVRHLEHLISAGVDGLVLAGPAGEGASLEYREKLELLRVAREAAAGRVPVLAAVVETTTSAACRFAAEAARLGVDGLMVLPALAYAADEQETLAHLRAVAHATGLPLLVGNSPGPHGVDLTPALFAELAAEPTLAAVRESSGDIRRIPQLLNRLGGCCIFIGADDLVLEAVLDGARGWVSGFANAFPRESRVLWDLAARGRLVQARELYLWFLPLLQLDSHPKFVQYIKLAQAECGVGGERIRAPRLPLEGQERDVVLAILRHAIRTRPDLSQFQMTG